MKIVYQIKDWDNVFENNKSRERKDCSFCCIPNKQDGLGYGTLIRMPNGEAMYGAFVAIVLMASKQKSRDGWLTDTGMPTDRPYTARQLSIKCQFSEKTIQDMLDAVCGEEVGWVTKHVFDSNEEQSTKPTETTAKPAESTPLPADCPPTALEEKRREEKGIEEKPSGDTPSTPKTHFKKSALIELAKPILEKLNQLTGRKYEPTAANLEMIASRIEEVKLDTAGIVTMLERQVKRWKGDPKMEEYLRVTTLFNRTKFHEYFSARELPVAPSQPLLPPVENGTAAKLRNATL